jgi:hypothetical protein
MLQCTLTHHNIKKKKKHTHTHTQKEIVKAAFTPEKYENVALLRTTKLETHEGQMHENLTNRETVSLRTV